MPISINRQSVVVIAATGLSDQYVSLETSDADGIAGSVDFSGENAIPAASPGELTTRTNDTDGTITLEAGHDVVTGRVDLYFDGGTRRGVTGTVTGDSLAIIGGSGDNLPLVNADIVAVNPVSEAISVPDPANLDAILFTGDNGVDYQIAGLDEVEEPDLEVFYGEAGGTPSTYAWTAASGIANPVTPAQVITIMYFSHGDTTAARNLRGYLLKS